MKKNTFRSTIAIAIATLFVQVNLTTISAQTKTTSLLWGEDGELWDSRGRLPDFTYAGYGGGYATKPSFTNTIDVTTQGVIPNDGLSDVAAIQTIINNAPDNSEIYFPAGRYVIDDHLTIDRSNILIKGDGDSTNGTVFYMPKSATDINGSFENDFSVGADGFMIHFVGVRHTYVAELTEEVFYGDTVIEVDDTRLISVGDIIELHADGDNPVNGELWDAYFNYQAADLPQPLSSWLDGNGGNMFHTIEKIEGNLVTFREPLRLDLKPSWRIRLRTRRNNTTNVGIENIRLEFIETAKKTHHEEPGYNAVQFENCTNFWATDLSIVHADNGINLQRSSYGEITDITFEGREGHHGFKIGYSALNLFSNIKFNNTKPYIHSGTLIHKSNGNVIRNVSGTQVISLDFHKNPPFSNLWTDVRTEFNHKSTGSPTAGYHAGARNVYWGLFGESTALYWARKNDFKENWGMFQNTIVSGLDFSDTSEMFTEEREWYENIPYEDLADKDLYKLQKEYRAGHTPVV
ncbi:MAG: glycosyl hydrolase family 28-related protein, partial [Leeuwenhoekiella sp.]